MKINRHNYEEIFLLYVDNELTPEERGAVESFVQQHSDLEEELNMLKQSVLRPDRKDVFGDRAVLLKREQLPNPVNTSNCEEYFILYGDGELTPEESGYVETFVYENPRFQHDFELIQTAKLSPDISMVFGNKSKLYRRERANRLLVLMTWQRMAVAAAVLLFAGAIGWNMFFRNTSADLQSNSNNVVIAETKKGHDNVDQQTKNSDKRVGPSTSPNASQQVVEHSPQKAAASQQRNAAESNSIEQDTREVAKNSAVPAINGTDAAREIDVKVPDAKTERPLVVSDVSNTTNSRQPVIDEAIGPQNANENDGGLKTYAVNDNSRTAVLNTSVNSKNKLRGFFRKVTRVIGRTTNLGPDDDNRGLHIANFEIALK